MPKAIFTTHDGKTFNIDGQVGDSLMQLAVRNGVPGIIGECGGVLSCATCHVIVNERDFACLAPMSNQEDEMLEGTAADRESTSRLCCQVKLVEDLPEISVRLPEYQE